MNFEEQKCNLCCNVHATLLCCNHCSNINCGNLSCSIIFPHSNNTIYIICKKCYTSIENKMSPFKKKKIKDTHFHFSNVVI